MNPYASTFNTSIRAFRTPNPFQPQAVGDYIPQIPEGADRDGINDGHVNENGIM